MSDNILMNTNSLKIKLFGLNDFVKDPAIVVLAKRGSGKTFLCRALLEHFRDIPVGVIISHTEKIDPFFSEFFPDIYIYDKYKPSIFEKILRRQITMLYKKKKKLAEGKTFDHRIFLLMDDCLASSKEWKNDENIKEILFNGRHYGITYILTMQVPMAITPELRANFDYVFMLSTDVQTDLEKYHKHYTSVFDTFKDFKVAYDVSTVDHGALVCKKRDNGKDITDKIFYYKAPEVHPTTIGCKQLKKFHERNYEPNWFLNSYNLKYDINDRTRKRGDRIVVERVDSHGRVVV